MLANWFAAVGTISAVIVALWFSYRDRKVNLNVWLYRASIVSDYEDNIEVVNLSIVNNGFRSVIIDGSITLKIPFFKNPYFTFFNDRLINQINLPYKLNGGERINLYIRNENFDEIIKKIIYEHDFKYFIFFKLENFIFSKLKAVVIIPTGERFKSKINKEFQKYLKLKFNTVKNILRDEQESKNTK